MPRIPEEVAQLNGNSSIQQSTVSAMISSILDFRLHCHFLRFRAKLVRAREGSLHQKVVCHIAVNLSHPFWGHDILSDLIMGHRIVMLTLSR